MDKQYNPPKKPTYRSLAQGSLLKAYAIQPLIVALAEDSTPDELENNFDEFIANKDNVVVALKNVKGTSLIKYQEAYGVPLQKKVLQLLSVQSYIAAGYAKATKKLEGDELTNNEELRKGIEETEKGYSTPYGFLEGSFNVAAMQLIAFLCSACGRIVGKDGTGYKVEYDLTTEDYLEIIPPQPFTSLEEDPDISLLELVFDVTGVYSFNLDSKTESAEPETATKGKKQKN